MYVFMCSAYDMFPQKHQTLICFSSQGVASSSAVCKQCKGCLSKTHTHIGRYTHPCAHTHTHTLTHMQIETHVINGAACRHSVTDCRRLAGLQATEWERAFRLGIGCAPSTFRDEWQAIVERTNWQLSWAELSFAFDIVISQRQRSAPYCLRCFISIGCCVRCVLL